MDEAYFVFAGDKGWWTKGGVFASDFKQAAMMRRDEAIRMCKRHANPIEGMLSAVPVRESDIVEVTSK
jgi:hypothetical protein